VASSSSDGVTVGLISDTHGLLRPQAVEALRNVQRIIHAGDIGGPEILAGLGTLAPVNAVRGNNDQGDWAVRLPEELTLNIAGVDVHVLHDVKALRLPPGVRVVIAGHSHKPGVSRREGVLYVNPGSAGPRRFKLPIAIAYLHIAAGSASAEIRHIL
jgi:hypothetical protein